jgi:hypothetical protein
MSQSARAKTATADWCKPTAELSSRDLAELLPRARRDSQPAAPVLGDSWFQDGAKGKVEAAVIVDRPPPVEPTIVFREPAPRESRPRTTMQKLTSRLARLTQSSRAVVYPNAPASRTWVWLVIGVAVATLAAVGALIRPF